MHAGFTLPRDDISPNNTNALKMKQIRRINAFSVNILPLYRIIRVHRGEIENNSIAYFPNFYKLNAHTRKRHPSTFHLTVIKNGLEPFTCALPSHLGVERLKRRAEERYDFTRLIVTISPCRAARRLLKEEASLLA